MSESIGADEYEKAVIRAFFLHTTLPIISRVKGVSCIIATGTLFKIAGRHFLVTAAHIAAICPPSGWSYSLHPRQGGIYPIGRCEFFTAHKPELDVAVVELKQPETIGRLEKNWRFLTLGNVWLPDRSADAVLLVGSPSEKIIGLKDNLHGGVCIVRQQYRADTPQYAGTSEPLTNGVDFFLTSQDALNEFTGEKVSAIDIRAMSGCSVWPYRKRGWTENRFWSPEVSLRLVGIQSASCESQYLRAKSWGAVLQTLALRG
jgi:hypothetical protein